MKYVKTLGLLAVAATALMAFAASASATTVTSSTGETPTFHATIGQTTFHGIATITCASGALSGSISSHGSGVTASGSISTLTYSECGPVHVTVLTNGTGANGTGTLEVHATMSTGNGAFTGNGTRITVQVTSLGVSCILETQNTTLGTVTGGENAILHLESANIPRVSGDSGIFCGSNFIVTGSYTFTHPSDFTFH